MSVNKGLIRIHSNISQINSSQYKDINCLRLSTKIINKCPVSELDDIQSGIVTNYEIYRQIIL